MTDHMTDSDVLRMLGTGLMLALKIAGPIMIASLVVGLIVSLAQSMFQLQDQTLPFVLKLVAAVAVCALLGPWMLHSATDFTVQLFSSIPQLVG